MRVLKVNVARSIWLFPVADLNPAGKALDRELLDWLQELIIFKNIPRRCLISIRKLKA
jgi:hypothetical protein